MNKPMYFYKFVSFDRKDILENGLIRFSPIGEFNDPFELEPEITPISRNFIEYVSNLSKQELAEIETDNSDLEYSSARAEEVETYKEKYNKKVGEFGVLSLSSNEKINQLLTVAIPEKDDPRTNILMWSHYAEYHKGFVIEFRPDFIEEINIEKVEYSDERECLTFEDIEENRFDSVFLKKSTEWAYEQEFRAILPLNKRSRLLGENIHLFKFNKSSINSITFGCAMSEENKKIIKEVIENDSAMNGVIFQHAYLSTEGYFLEFYGEYGSWTNNPMYSGRIIPSQKKL